MTDAGETDRRGGIGFTPAAGGQRLNSFDAPLQYIAIRAFTGAVTKEPREVELAYVCLARQILQSDWIVELCLDQVGDASEDQTGQASRAENGPRLRQSKSFYEIHGKGTPQLLTEGRPEWRSFDGIGQHQLTERFDFPVPETPLYLKFHGLVVSVAHFGYESRRDGEQ